jgi:2-polyprenyl-6-methoxyphenol hydroxylase-like FAD-dependent oxidoreductase
MHAEIAGTGFAGRTTAIALRHRGWSVRVHEKDAALRAFGAGIFIWENGLRVLHAIGAAEDVVRGAHQAPAQVRAAELARTARLAAACGGTIPACVQRCTFRPLPGRRSMRRFGSASVWMKDLAGQAAVASEEHLQKIEDAAGVDEIDALQPNLPGAVC